MEVRAVAKNTGLPPRKVRLVLNMVRGKKVNEALAVLQFTPTPMAGTVARVIKSAAANAESNFQITAADLRIVRIFADAAPSLKRFRARARGRAGNILKRSSHITVVVAEEES